MQNIAPRLGLAAALALAGLLAGGAQAAPSLAGWTGQGSFGAGTANGVVGASPIGDGYLYVTTLDGEAGAGTLGDGLGKETTGSRLTSPLFSATADQKLTLYFAYVTSDGGSETLEFSDYAWARLLDADGNQVALLFTARTAKDGNTVPGSGLPDIDATLTPATVKIDPANPADQDANGDNPHTLWDALGADSERCFGAGCGHTGWVKSQFTIRAAGDYRLEFGVTNWLDNTFQSGLAFAVAGRETPVPEPASLALLGMGLLGLGFAARRRA